ncbi:MAG: hypothetical protein ACP5M0_03380 [Desulfomonilaceae bacterium]
MVLRFRIMMWTALVVFLISAANAWAQTEVEPEPDRVGQFQITVKTLPPQTISIEDFTLDPDEDKKLTAGATAQRKFLYRIRPEGFMAFDEEKWVNRIQFKMFNQPATQSQQYKELAELLTDVNRSIREFKETLNDYYQYGTRLIDFCDDPQFKSLNSLDAAIGVQLAHYNQLLKIRQSIVKDLVMLTGEIGCRDVAADYKKKLSDLRGSMNKILAGTHPLGDRYKELKKETPLGGPETHSAPGTVTPPRAPAAR